MKRMSLFIALALAVIVAGAHFSNAADDGAEKPKAAKKETKAKVPSVTKPWKDLSNLSDDQKTRIAEIHKKALEEKDAIEKREHNDIVAVLTEEQKAELATIEAEKDTKGKEAKKEEKKEMKEEKKEEKAEKKAS